MSILRLFIITISAVFLTSCGAKTYKLSDTDFEWIPYNGKDTLVFTSNLGDTDTLFLRKGQKYMEYQVNPLSMKPADSTENFSISYKLNYFDTIQKINNFGVWPLIIMRRGEDGITNIGFSITRSEAYLEGMKFFSIDKLKRQKFETIETNLKRYEDVFIIVPDTFSLRYSNPGDYVVRMYWSKSEGLVRYDKNNNVFYTLTKKHSLK